MTDLTPTIDCRGTTKKPVLLFRQTLKNITHRRVSCWLSHHGYTVHMSCKDGWEWLIHTYVYVDTLTAASDVASLESQRRRVQEHIKTYLLKHDTLQDTPLAEPVADQASAVVVEPLLADAFFRFR